MTTRVEAAYRTLGNVIVRRLPATAIPVMKLESSQARKSAAFATSSDVPMPPNGVEEMM